MGSNRVCIQSIDAYYMFFANGIRKKPGLHERGESRVTGASGAQGCHCASCGAASASVLRIVDLNWLNQILSDAHSIQDLG